MKFCEQMHDWFLNNKKKKLKAQALFQLLRSTLAERFYI